MKKAVVMVLTKDALKPHVDGRVYQEAKTLINNGFKVTILCRVYSLSGVAIEEEYDGITVIRQLCKLDKVEYKSRINQLIQNFKNVKIMADRIVKLKPDFIHAHDLNALLESVLAKRKLGVPLIYDSHEDWPKLEQSKGNNLAYLLALIYENFLLSHVKNVITVNQTLAKKFNGRKPTTIIYNYPKISQFKPKAEMVNEIQKKYDLEGKIVIEYHGVIGEAKGINELLGAAEKLVKKFKNLRFLIIGQGSENVINNEQVQRLKKYVIFTGPVKYDLIPTYIAVSDISYLVLKPTSQYLVSTPTKLFEAMLMGKPVIANAEFPEVVKIMGEVKKNRPGIMVNYNSNEILNALKKLIENKVLREEFGGNGQNKARKYYSWEKQEEELVNFYKRL